MAHAQDAQTASQLPFDEVARLPLPGDNVAIATRTLAAGTQIEFNRTVLTLDYTVMEGHRFAVAPIPQGAPLLSWELPFGLAARAIAPGEYIRNAEMLDALGVRALDFELPGEPNFADHVQAYNLDENSFQPGRQVSRYSEDRHFEGYARPGGRGVGTRNVIILLGTSSRTGGFVRQLEARFAGVAQRYGNIDGIVAVAHTEGGHDNPNNTETVLRTLAGFVTHSNVGAVLCVDYGVEPVNNALLRKFLTDNDYPLDAVPHAFLTLKGGFQAGLLQAEAIVKGWLDQVSAMPRTAQPLSELKLALQCGGSDAFSGISGNPLASWVARELVRYGGAANLAETDELIGAEPYIMLNVRDAGTAAEFLKMIERFQERVAWHGHSAAGNPSGGNKYRGLYNIVLKSIGAAMKRHPDVRLDHVIPYSGPMQEPGYYFMDSPGNDLESIAGQVASGCNMIYFVTGNGSITNFPFVPTIKIVTTTRRYELLSQDMDVNAGLYLDGTPMDELGAGTLDLTVRAASGERTVGERAGHAQVQLWRDWRQTGPGRVEEISARPQPLGRALPLRPSFAAPSLDFSYPAFATPAGLAADRIGLILPTSLCSGQIGQIAAARLNRRFTAGKESRRRSSDSWRWPTPRGAVSPAGIPGTSTCALFWAICATPRPPRPCSLNMAAKRRTTTISAANWKKTEWTWTASVGPAFSWMAGLRRSLKRSMPGSNSGWPRLTRRSRRWPVFPPFASGSSAPGRRGKMFPLNLVVWRPPLRQAAVRLSCPKTRRFFRIARFLTGVSETARTCPRWPTDSHWPARTNGAVST